MRSFKPFVSGALWEETSGTEKRRSISRLSQVRSGRRCFQFLLTFRKSFQGGFETVIFKWFDEIIGDAAGNKPADGFCVVGRGYHDDRRGHTSRVELVDKFVAVHLRRVVVENNQVNRAVLQILQGKDAVLKVAST